MWASPYFTYEEFDSPDEPGSGEKMNFQFIGKLEQLREKCNFPFIINSGFRTVSHNQMVGGKVGSAHLKGLAADISITNDRQRFAIIKFALEMGFRRIEVGTVNDKKLWVHLDVDESLPQDVLF